MRFFDRDGKPLEMMEWARLFEDPEYQQVELTIVGEARVSTVWLGLDHAIGIGIFGFPQPPLIFETMIFGGPCDTQCWRYHTETAAREGHSVAVMIAEGVTVN